jgi:hypothetical protein
MTNESERASDAASILIEGIDARVFDEVCRTEKQREFLRNRWLHEVAYLAKVTRRSRMIYYGLSLLSLGAAVGTSFVAALSVSLAIDGVRWLTAALGLLTAVSTGLFGLFKPWENWERRSLALEQLKFEGRMFAIRGAHYKAIAEPDIAFNTFAEAVEKIVSDNKSRYFRSQRPSVPPAVPKISSKRKSTQTNP